MKIALGKQGTAQMDKVLGEHAVKADEAISKGASKGKLAAVEHIAALVEAGDSVRQAVARLPHVLNPKTGKTEPRKSSGAWQETYRTVTRLVKIGKLGPADMVTRLAETDWSSFADLTKAVETDYAALEASGTIKTRKVERKPKSQTERAAAYVATLVKMVRKIETEGIIRKDAEPIRAFNLADSLVNALTGKAVMVLFKPEPVAEPAKVEQAA